MVKGKLTITLKVLNEVKVQFSETKEFTEERLEQEVSQIKYFSGRGNFSFYKPRSTELAHKNIF